MGLFIMQDLPLGQAPQTQLSQNVFEQGELCLGHRLHCRRVDGAQE